MSSKTSLETLVAKCGECGSDETYPMPDGKSVRCKVCWEVTKVVAKDAVGDR